MRAFVTGCYVMMGILAGAVGLTVAMRVAWAMNGEEGLEIIIVCYVLAALLFSAKDPR